MNPQKMRLPKRKVETLLRRVFDTVPVGMMVLDKNGTILESNAAARDLYKTKLIGECIARFTPMKVAITEALALIGKKGFESGSFQAVRRDGRKFPVRYDLYSDGKGHFVLSVQLINKPPWCKREYGLTTQEIAICDLTVTGVSASEIGHRLNISKPTVHKHCANIRNKFKLRGAKVMLREYLENLT